MENSWHHAISRLNLRKKGQKSFKCWWILKYISIAFLFYLFIYLFFFQKKQLRSFYEMEIEEAFYTGDN